MKMKDKYIELSEEHYANIMRRYKVFQDTLNDVSTNPAQVYNKLSQANMEELLLIRQVSSELQSKKEDDAKKAAQAAANQDAEEKKEEVKEEKTDVK